MGGGEGYLIGVLSIRESYSLGFVLGPPYFRKLLRSALSMGFWSPGQAPQAFQVTTSIWLAQCSLSAGIDIVSRALTATSEGRARSMKLFWGFGFRGLGFRGLGV